MNEHNDWILEKSYLENQVTFLKNTLNENKRLHDALLVALQRTSIVKVESVNTPQEESSNELVQTNKNLSSAMEKLESRCRLLEEKSEKLKKFKNIVSPAVSLGKELRGAPMPALLQVDSKHDLPAASHSLC